MDEPARATRGARGFTTSITALLVVLVVAAASQLPGSMTPGWLGDRRDTYQLLWPQQWEFFTAVGSVAVGVYRSGGYQPVTAPLASAQNLGGLSRREYATIVEAAVLARSVPAARWRDCGRPAVADCADRLAGAPVTTVDSRVAWQPLCGTVVFTRERLVAGAWQVQSAAPAELACAR
ncbi:hypothetical protein [Couchioplanes caeruleus]|uniref:Antimicrobial peptide export protein n=2 Tax=Couchioplanes caeruleus TaxID=56438 RepID=A0A1K0FTF3_9ACTN|nr:hypothetical protein [Couchioplanes caeruleus]OJF15944.1 Antimicrobial peptide export protein [Couchioplanes caeruleus subsp. caeruleus]ROP28534.1 hypothetical protein EDD30_1298 [Couchioplanes caeruleus]